MASNSIGVRERMEAASRRIAWVKLVDRSATWVITLGGVFIIVSVLFIFVFIFAEALPLFRGASAEKVQTLALASAPGAAVASQELPLVLSIDERQMYLYEVTPADRLVVFRLTDGSRQREIEIPGLAGTRLVSAGRTLAGDAIAAGTADGRVALLRIRFRPVFDGQVLKDLVFELRSNDVLTVDPAGRPVRQVSVEGAAEGDRLLAAQVADAEIVLARLPEATEGQPPPAPVLTTLRTQGGEVLTRLRLGQGGLVAGTRNGRLYHWQLDGGAPRLTDAASAGDAPITALAWAVGGNTLLVGDEKGAVSAWFRARPSAEADLALVKAHAFEPQHTAIVSIGASSRERSFLTGGADGSIVLRHVTSERTLLSFRGDGRAAEMVLVTPRADGMLVRRTDGSVERYALHNPHPEFSWRALLGKVWYEGYPGPAYVWQSTGATEAFESKLSLVPLVFGTIKATLYALLFAMPLAVMGALYTSQFVHPSIKAKVKPTVEIMAALPSVVIGFIAGLWLASRVEAALVPVLLLVLLLPVAGTAGVLAWDRLPYGLRRRLRPGTELALILPLLLVGGWAALAVGPWIEAVAFHGDVRGWLSSTLGLVYDQRNSVIVGLAMGFAVIPIIFTISEDAFSSVPQHLTAASLALGASRWQTAVRVVLPTASPGVFSAIMVGFGRAVGETMIVLMATGNTPLLDWSPFNGMRTLSANIAVEVPEAPYGGTLYRVLFLSACVLFVMTFLVNTVAELVRQRLREKYRAI
ncbi:MAG TPA: ABC transporter permease subunit [Vicinamibacteria bacterium]|nr:ABC transporter permease subunit [Vicinamibacteria bacterium]